MISFCDIPISHITSHTEKYGNYGIGLSKKWAESNGINPVLYLEEYSSSTRLIEPLIRDVIKNDEYGDIRLDLKTETKDNIATIKFIDDRERELKINAIVGQLSFIKNYKGELNRKGKPCIQYRFYDEQRMALCSNCFSNE